LKEVVRTAEQFDLVVIGGGPGGYASAFYAASAGMNVALIERDTIGGTCLNRGCIPAKAFLETAAANRHVQHAGDFGINATVNGIDFGVAQTRKQTIVNGLVKGLTGLTKTKKVTYLLGTGSLGPNKTVTVQLADGSTQQLQGKNIVIAAGSTPRTIPGFTPGGPIMTSDEVLMLSKIPQRIAVIGGGAIGCEFASTFADLGSQVTILEGLPKILPGLDPDLAFVVDGYCQTGEPGVYAVGDIVNTPQLAHVAYSEAIVAVKHMRGEVVYPVMYDRVPWAIYCHPEVAWAGPSEEAAIAAGHDVVVAKHAFRSNSRAMILGETDGLVKIIAKKNADGTPGQVLGVHMVGPWVTEQLSGGYLAVNWEATVDEIAEFIQPHPSLSETFGETVLSLTGRTING